MNDLRFDAEKHEYLVGGERVPSVTEIVGAVVGGPQWATEWHLARGSALHEAIALYMRGRLDESSVDERIKGRLEAAKLAIETWSLLDGARIEEPLAHPVLKFAGTPDLFTASGILVDWKSSHRDDSEIQMGGYLSLIEANKQGPVKKCLEITLNENGTYTPETYSPARCRGLFSAALSIYQWREAHGGK